MVTESGKEKVKQNEDKKIKGKTLIQIFHIRALAALKT